MGQAAGTAAALMCRSALTAEQVVQPLQQALRHDGAELGH
jgi:hypothetical protein